MEGTDFTLRAIPLGGFVRVKGMEHEAAADEQSDEDGFNKRPVFQRFWVILAGPLFSLLLGYLAYVVLFLGFGTPSGRPRIEAVSPGRPAAIAGFRAGDVVTAVEGNPVGPREMLLAIETSAGKSLRVTVERAGTPVDLEVVPEAIEDNGTKVGRIGVRPGNELVPAPPAVAFPEAWKATIGYFTSLKNVLGSGKAKEAVGGPVGIARTFYQTSGTGLSTRIELLASLSLSLFLFNILPIPVLDGGHLMLFFVEAVRRRRLSAEAMKRVHLTGFALLATLFVFVMFNDITRWIGIR